MIHDLMGVITLVSFAGFNLIRFNGSRINGLSQEALRQDECAV